MAEKPEELETPADKVLRGKELFASGSRNYYVAAYAEAADDLSQACSLLAEFSGPTAEDCALPYLIYAKTLIALNKVDNKVLDVPEGTDDDESPADAEGEEGDEGDDEEGEEDEENGDEAEKNGDEVEENGAETAKPTNGTTADDDAEKAEENGKSEEKQNGDAATTNGTAAGGSTTEAAEEGVPGTSNAEEEEESGLEIAWEVLELAAIIFARQGEEALPNLADTYTELAGISMENSHFDFAIKDYLRSLDVLDRMKEPSKRHIAELHFKIGLCHSFLGEFDNSFTALKKAIELLDMEIETEKALEQTEKVVSTIKDLEEIKADIQDKITEIAEQKQESIDEVKKKLGEFLSRDANAEDSDGPGPSKSDVEKPKPKDISHLIKRKKPDDFSAETIEGSPAKKQALESPAKKPPVDS